MRSRPWLVPAIAGAIVALLGAGYCILDYATYRATAYDLGFFDQVVEQTAHGQAFMSSFTKYSFLGQHWEPILVIPALLDRIVATPIWLILIQAVALGLAPVAAWRLARAWLGGDSGIGPAVIAIAVALSPIVMRTATFDFHAEALTPVLALFALDAAARGRRWVFVVLCLVLFTVKEDAFIVVMGIGWIAWLQNRDRLALAVIVGGAIGFVVIVGFVMPALRNDQPSDLLARYAYMGASTPLGLLTATVLHPDRWIGHLTAAPALRGLEIALLPLALLPLVSGWALIGALPALLISLLSADADQAQLAYHYGMEGFPLLVACAILGWRRVAHYAGPRRLLAPTLLASAVAAYVLAAPMPGGMAFHPAGLDQLQRRAQVDAILAKIPSDAAVTASSGLVPHLSNRAHIYEFPALYDSTYAVVDAWGPASQQTLQSGYFHRIAELSADGFHVIASDAGVTRWEKT